MNILNVMAGVLGFIIGSAIVWATWDAITQITALLPSVLGTALNVMYASIIIIGCLVIPITLTLADDEGEV